ncbi:MAG: GyrI-like domain-containing protein [Bryobacteraceae bacterium]
MGKIDLKKQWKSLYTASAKKPALIEVPKIKYLMIDGSGDPNLNPRFQEAFQALYGVAYTLKFSLKMGPEKIDYPIMPPSGLWWTDAEPFDMANRSSWKWTLMIPQPDCITAAMVRQAKKTVREKKALALADEVRLEAYREGTAVQIMHLGPYSEEPPTIQKLHQFAADSGYSLNGKHHEIYFSDPRRTKPERMRTLLRQPVKKR